MNNRGPEENINYFNPDSGGSNFTYTTTSRQRVEGTNMGGGTCTEVFSCSDYQYQIINIYGSVANFESSTGCTQNDATNAPC